jgi:hypothetical protein
MEHSTIFYGFAEIRDGFPLHLQIPVKKIVACQQRLAVDDPISLYPDELL